MSHASDAEQGYELVAAIAFGIGVLLVLAVIASVVVAVVQARKRRTPPP